MQEKAEERFSVDKADLLVHDITIDFEMMGDTEEYRALKDLQKVLLYDTVVAINEQIQMSVTVEVSEIEYDCIREKVTALKLTNVNAYHGKNVSGFNVFNNSITPDKLTDDTLDGIADYAVEDANEYTDGKVSNLNYSLRAWVNDNFEPKASE
jgi:phage-related protein